MLENRDFFLFNLIIYYTHTQVKKEQTMLLLE